MTTDQVKVQKSKCRSQSAGSWSGRRTPVSHILQFGCCLTCVLLAAPVAGAQVGRLTADSIVARLDDNSTAGSLSFEATMTISLGGQVREKSFQGYGEDGDRSYVEFTGPARDRGTRFLKLGNEMWMWLPRVGKSTKLAGHLLRQSMMGSDFSYSDATSNSRLLDNYDAELVGTDTVSGKVCYVVDLVARTDEVDYARQKVWVTPDDFIAAKVEFYARSGKLLKEMRVEGFRRIEGKRGVRWQNFPTRVRMTNLLRRNTFTVMEITEIVLDPEIPAEVFTKSYLER